MKKVLTGVLVMLATILLVIPTVAADTELKFEVNGEPYVTPEGEPNPYINVDQRTMVPVRFFADGLQVPSNQIEWDQVLQRVTLTKDDRTVEITLGRAYLYVNDVRVTMDTRAEMKGGRVFIPARFIAEGLGAKISWDQSNQVIRIEDDPDAELPEPNIPTVIVDGIKMLGVLDPTGETPDSWGRAVRTTDLPENAEDFPYVLEGVPNEMYERPFNERYFPPNRFQSAAKAYDEYPALKNKDYVTDWWKRVHNYYDMVLNVDYRTIGDSSEWAKEIFEYRNQMVNHQYTLNNYSKYADRVKENRIIIEGELILEPTIIVDGHGVVSRAYVNIEIAKSDTDKDLVAWEKSEIPLDIAKRYHGFADIELGNVSSSIDNKDLRVGNMASLFEFASYIIKGE